jgi:hypothetical protein
MADTIPTTSRTLVSKIPMRSASTRKPASYNKNVRRYDLKYRGPSTPDTSSTTSPRTPTLAPTTSDNASPDMQKEATRDLNQLKANTSRTSPTGPAAPQSTPQPFNSDAPTALTSKLARFKRRALTTSTFTPPSAVNTPGPLENSDDTYSPPDPLLHRTQALLHAELETLMQALYLRLRTAPHLSMSYVQAFETLAADTLYEGMGERLCADIQHRQAREGDKREQFTTTLENHLLREAAKNIRRYKRGLNFFEEHDTKSTVTEVRSCLRLHQSDGELTTSSLTDEEEQWLEDVQYKYVEGLAAIKCNCQTCMDGMEQLIAEYWAAVQRGYVTVQRGYVTVQRGYVAVQEAESGMGSRDLPEQEGRWFVNGARDLQDLLSDYTSDWASTDSEQDEQDEQDAEMKHAITEDETRWAARVNAYLLDQGWIWTQR